MDGWTVIYVVSEGFLKKYLFTFRGEGRERNINVGEIQRSIASRTPPSRDLVTAQACALIGI